MSAYGNDFPTPKIKSWNKIWACRNDFSPPGYFLENDLQTPPPPKKKEPVSKKISKRADGKFFLAYVTDDFKTKKNWGNVRKFVEEKNCTFFLAACRTDVAPALPARLLPLVHPIPGHSRGGPGTAPAAGGAEGDDRSRHCEAPRNQGAI